MVRVLAIDVGQRDLGCCFVERDRNDDSNFTVIDWTVLDLGQGPVRNAVHAFCGLVSRWKEVDLCVIEQQTNVNKNMLALSHAIQAAVCMHDPRTKVVFASPRTMFACFAAGDSEPRAASPYQRKKARKKKSVAIATDLLSRKIEHAPWLQKLMTSKTGIKDDLSDSLLYSLGADLSSCDTAAASASTCFDKMGTAAESGDGGGS